MEACTLSFAERLVLTCEDGPPEAEYALFESGEIELKATSPGAIREVGYETTAEDALQRLSNVGITPQLAIDAAQAMGPHMIAAYARGPVVRRAAEALGPAELFATRVYRARAYEGVWLDLSRLAVDLELPNAAIALQLVGLVASIAELEGSTRIKLRTAPYTETRRPGERTYRRVDVSSALLLVDRLRELSARPHSALQERETGPTHVEILDVIRERSATANSAAKEHLSALERATAAPSDRTQPVQGPLSDPVMWAIEAQLSQGDIQGAKKRISEVERQRGALPSVQYLKSRMSLLAGAEPPEVVAERVSLLVAKAPFAELELLAAQAWAAAGNMGRALPYARVLSMDPTADAFVRGHARAIVDAAKQGVRSMPVTQPPSSSPRSGPRAEASEKITSPPHRDKSSDLPPILDPKMRATPEERTIAVRPQERSIKTPPAPPGSTPWPIERESGRMPKGRLLASTPPEIDLDLAVGSSSEQRPVSTPRHTSSGRPRSMMRGASQPAVELWKNMDTIAEVVEELSPPWDVGDAPGAAEARAQFTDMARELGRWYRTEKRIVIKTDADGIETMQTFLRQTMKASVRSTSAMVDVRRHGAVLSEILARRLQGQWVDVQQPELGHWTMDIQGVVRVRPFGRILRFLEHADHERDLVSYYLELFNLASGANVRP